MLKFNFFIEKNFSKTVLVWLVLFSLIVSIRPPSLAITTSTNNYNPNYYYNKETAFILNYAIDYTNGGMYMGLDENGTPIPKIKSSAWSLGSGFDGSTKVPATHGTCIRHLINEYDRLKANAEQLAPLNALITGTSKLETASQVLDKAKFCADGIFKMEIPDSKNVTMIDPNKMFYYGFSKKDYSEGHDPSDPAHSAGNDRNSESNLAWSLVEYAIVLKRDGRPSLEYQPYVDGAKRWLNWRTTKARARTQNGGIVSYKEPGVARDNYYLPLAYALALITGDNSYVDDTTGVMADGNPVGAKKFYEVFGGTGNYMTSNGLDPVVGTSYVPGFSRAIAYDYAIKRGDSPATLNSLWDFGTTPIIIGNNIDPYQSTYDLTKNLSHYAGREIVGGAQRSLWFYNKYGSNPKSVTPYSKIGPKATPKLNKSVVDYWNYANEQFWDYATVGKESWLESTDLTEKIKPCFSGANDVLIADTSKPIIVDKVHTLNPDGSAKVVVSGVMDPDFNYLNTTLPGVGIERVEIIYSINNGTTWNTLVTTLNGSNYETTIPAITSGKTLYYAKAIDKQNNTTLFPAGSEEIDPQTNAVISKDVTKMQSYVVKVPAEVSVTIADNTDKTEIAKPITYEIVITNKGTNPIKKANLNYNFPIETQRVITLSENAVYDPSTGALDFISSASPDGLIPGKTLIIKVEGLVSSTLMVGDEPKGDVKIVLDSELYLEESNQTDNTAFDPITIIQTIIPIDLVVPEPTPLPIPAIDPLPVVVTTTPVKVEQIQKEITPRTGGQTLLIAPLALILCILGLYIVRLHLRAKAK